MFPKVYKNITILWSGTVDVRRTMSTDQSIEREVARRELSKAANDMGIGFLRFEQDASTKLRFEELVRCVNKVARIIGEPPLLKDLTELNFREAIRSELIQKSSPSLSEELHNKVIGIDMASKPDCTAIKVISDKFTLYVERLRDWSYGVFMDDDSTSCIATGYTPADALQLALDRLEWKVVVIK